MDQTLKTDRIKTGCPARIAPIMLTVLMLAAIFKAFDSRAQEDCVDQTSISGYCLSNAFLVYQNIFASPPAPAGAPYDSIVSVCDTVTFHLQWHTVPSQAVIQTCDTCPIPDCGPLTTNTAWASPYNITNEWWNFWWTGYSNNVGDTFSFSFTNAMAGSVIFQPLSMMMPTNQPECGVTWINATNGHFASSYAFVSVNSLSVSPGFMPPYYSDGSPNTSTYLVGYCPGSYTVVTANYAPAMNDKYLPADWNFAASSGSAIQATNADGNLSRSVLLVDNGTVRTTVLTATAGCSSQTVTVIVYEAKYAIDADRGASHLDVGHAWWNLSVSPNDAYQFLVTAGGTDLSADLGIAGYYGNHSPGCAGDTGCPGHVTFGPQPNGTNGAVHTATGSYSWCISFGDLVNALTYVFDLDSSSGTYSVYYNNCVTQALTVGSCAGISVGYSGFKPWGLSDYINSLPPATCTCH